MRESRVDFGLLPFPNISSAIKADALKQFPTLQAFKSQEAPFKM